MFGDSSPFVRLKVFEENMRPVIKRRRECSEPPFEHSSLRNPASSFCPLRLPSEPSRRQPSASSLRSHTPSAHVRRPLRRSAYCYAPSLSASPATGYSLRSVAPASFGYVSEGVRASGTRRPHLRCGAVCHGSAISPRHTPTSSDTKKGDGRPSPSGCQTATLPSRARRFRACWNPTLSPLP